MPVREEKAHLETECIKRKVGCNWCGFVSTYERRRAHKFADCPGRWEKAAEMCEMIYLCRPIKELAELVNDGAHPTIG